VQQLRWLAASLTKLHKTAQISGKLVAY